MYILLFIYMLRVYLLFILLIFYLYEYFSVHHVSLLIIAMSRGCSKALCCMVHVTIKCTRVCVLET